MAAIVVIVPVYKVEKYLVRCIDSILGQSFRDFELLLIDDGSPDQSGEICDRYAERDERIKVIHQQNAGVSAARNRGIEEALKSGCHWVTFIDSDDWISTNFLESLFNAAINNGVNIAYGSYIYTESENVSEVSSADCTEIHTPTEWYLDKVDTLLVQAPWSKLFAVELFQNKEFRFPVGIRYEDSAAVYKIVFSQEHAVKCESATYYYFVNNDGFMLSGWRPERMQYVDVLKEQTRWLAEHGFDDAAGMAADTLLIGICEQCGEIEKNPEFSQYIKKLRKTVRFLLRRYKKQGKFTIRKNHWYYDVGYPRLMWIYWTVRAQLDKFRKRFA